MLRRAVAIAILACLSLCGSAALAADKYDAMPDIFRVTLESVNRFEGNKEKYIEKDVITTANEAVTAELNALADGYDALLTPDMQLDPRKNAARNSRLDVHIVYSRTGESWLSAMVLGRVSFQRKQVASPFTTRTYDLATGERKRLTDLFADDSAAWDILAAGARDALTTAFPGEQPDPAALQALCDKQSLANADFTMGGMELTLHFPAEAIYPERHNILHARFYYPQFAGMLTDEGVLATDNSRWKMVAITCDDGPSYPNTNKTLNELRKLGVRATFFVVGKLCVEYGDVMMRTADENHLIAGHTFNHSHGHAIKSLENRRKAVDSLDDMLLDTVGVRARYFRAPGGTFPPWIEAQIDKPIIQWSVDTYDYRGRSVTNICAAMRKFVTEGDIILTHDSSENMNKAVAKWVTHLQDNGFMPVTVEELAYAQNVQPRDCEVYFRMLDGVYADRTDSNTN